MDRSNLEHLQAMQPSDSRAELRLLLDFHPRREQPDALLSRCAGEVPDPYYGEAEGFEEVLDLVEQACAGLLQHRSEERRVGKEGRARWSLTPYRGYVGMARGFTMLTTLRMGVLGRL